MLLSGAIELIQSLEWRKEIGWLNAKYEFVSSNTTGSTFAFDAYLETSASSGRTKRLFHRKSMAKIDAIEHVLNDANSYLAYWCVVGEYKTRTIKSLVKYLVVYVSCAERSIQSGSLTPTYFFLFVYERLLILFLIFALALLMRKTMKETLPPS
jgi:hypothetical protein